jgi:hypothetical protein
MVVFVVVNGSFGDGGGSGVDFCGGVCGGFCVMVHGFLVGFCGSL